jgi:two-component system phosphate regulon response regulator PhoB
MRTATSQPLILIVEDEPSLVTLLKYNLEQDGYRTAEAMDGNAALALVSRERPDLVLLDWMLPGLSGIEVCREIRRRPALHDLPVLMLTARTEEADKIRGLDVGADDYLTKPFSLPELRARVRALLRRTRPAGAKGRLAFADVVMDLAGRRVTRGGQAVHLGPTEYRLLQFFLQNAGIVFSRDDLLHAVWGSDINIESRTVDVHIRRLRQALNGDGEQPDLIRTVRSAGYAFGVDDDPQ